MLWPTRPEQNVEAGEEHDSQRKHILTGQKNIKYLKKYFIFDLHYVRPERNIIAP